MGERVTLVWPDHDIAFKQQVASMVEARLAGAFDVRRVTLPDPRPILSKWGHLPTLARLRGGEGAFHVEQNYLPDLAFLRWPRAVGAVWDMVPTLYPEWYPGTLAERLDARLSGRGARNAGALVTISHFQKQEIAKLLPYPEERLFVCRIAVDHARFTPGTPKVREQARAELRRRYGLGDDEVMLLSLSGWVPRKNVPGVLRVAHELRRRGRKARVLMRDLGSRAVWREPVMKVVEELGMGPHIVWIPRLSDEELVRHFRGVHALLFPTYYEGQGLPPLEAMACGCPVVASDRSTMPEMIGEGGLMRDPDDVAGLADAVEAVLDDDALRRELHEKGLAQAARFTWDDGAAETRAAYESVLRR